MRLEFASFPVKDVRFGKQTGYNNGVLEINKAELVALVTASKQSGIFMIGGGVPKNFVQDTVLGVEVDPSGKLLEDVRMHKYAIQITVADERDGGLSGSTLKEAESWGKVDGNNSQMVFAEATLVLPLLASYVYHKGSWKDRQPKEFATRLGK